MPIADFCDYVQFKCKSFWKSKLEGFTKARAKLYVKLILPFLTEVFIWDGKDLEDDSVFVSASNWHNFKFVATRDDSGAVLDFMELLGIPIIPIALRFLIDISLNCPLVEVAVQPKKLIMWAGNKFYEAHLLWCQNRIIASKVH